MKTSEQMRKVERPGAAVTRLRLGEVEIDVLTFAQALDAIERLVEGRQGGFVVTPNVDHVVNASRHPLLRQAYGTASLSLVDGTPVVWASRLLGCALPEKISGSDLVLPLMARAAERQWRVFLTGARPGIAELAAEKLRLLGANIVGTDCPNLTLGPDGVLGGEEAATRARLANPDLVLAAFGSPKQEIWLSQNQHLLRPAAGLAVGAGLDFIAGSL
ncbi:MAG: WecB/TagA/CpsF family glycosyltransferase, partial [Deltaproteobacteria bacterium]|nr:WecB/TagA/CpsF family glycosyltransferase [Deltaproteobacteria bacterium]